MEMTQLQLDMNLRAQVRELCAPVWWETGRKTIVHSGTMCVIKTPDAVFGVTNHHVLAAYENAAAADADVFGQLGSGPFNPTENLIACSKYWNLATFRIPDITLQNFGHKGFLARSWPPKPIEQGDHVVFGGYPEMRRSVSAGQFPKGMSIDFVSFRSMPHCCSAEQISFHLDPAQVTWLPNVTNPMEPGASLSGMSGGPCFGSFPGRIELSSPASSTKASTTWASSWCAKPVSFPRPVASARSRIRPFASWALSLDTSRWRVRLEA